MENKEISIRQWITNYNNGKYDSQDVNVQCEAGWYDWFCRSSSLANKTKKMAIKIKQLAKSPKVDIDNWYIWFKNCCPFAGPIYDTFSFADIKSGDTIYVISFQKGTGTSVELYHNENDFRHPIVAGDWADIKEYFGV